MFQRTLSATLVASLLASAAPLWAQATAPQGPAGDQPATGTASSEGAAAGGDVSGTTAPDTATGTAPSETSIDTVVATVNGTDITLGNVIALATRLPQQYQQLPDDVLLQGLVDQLVQQAALAAEGGELSKGAELVLENERRTLLANEALADTAMSAVTDDALQAAYDEQYASAEPVTEYNAAHILLETEDEAQSVISELEGGADFAEVARAKSTGPSAPNGGDLGWFATGTMVKPFEDAVTQLEPGQISAPVQTQFGWHVIKLNEAREREVPTLDAVREELAATIQRQAIEQAVNAATSAAQIERADLSGIDPAVVRDVTLLED